MGLTWTGAQDRKQQKEIQLVAAARSIHQTNFPFVGNTPATGYIWKSARPFAVRTGCLITLST
jgi:hypothetical protein